MKGKNSTNVIKKLYTSLSPIQAMMEAFPAINTLISSFIIGNTIGQPALATLGFAGPLMYIMLAFASVLSTGSQVVCSKYIGQGDRKGINTAFNTTIFLCLIFGAVIGILTFLFPTTIAKLLGTTGELQIMTSDYIKGSALYCFSSVLLNCVIPFLQLDCKNAMTTVCLITQIVLSVIFNLVNAFSLQWGMLGVGLAASLSTALTALIGIVYLALNSNLFTFSISNLKFKECLNIITYGYSNALSFALFSIKDIIFNKIVFAMGGSVLLSAFTVANNLSDTVGCAVEGAVLGPSNIIAGVLVGERDIESFRDLPKTAIKTNYPVNIVCYALIFIFAKQFALLFGAEPEHIATYVYVIRAFNLWFLTNPLKSVAIASYTALKKVTLLGVGNTLYLFVFPVICFFIAKPTNSLFLVSGYAFIAEALLLVVFIVYYIVKTRSYELSWTKYIYIPRDLAVPKKDTMSLAVSNTSEALKASEKVIEFCKQKGMSEKNSTYCGLCVEEIAVDKIQNCFMKKSDTLDIRLIFENNQMTIMFRDNCFQFNPTQWLELHAENDPLRSIGLKMVTKLAKEMDYSNNLNLNILTIKI